MPTETFYHLPEEKRDRLVSAIRRELSCTPFDELSINRIVKDAGIPRGSYYQYFRNKQDLYDFVLADLGLLLIKSIGETLSRNGGDLFHALTTGFDAAAQYARTQESATLFANMLSGFGEKCRATPGRLLGCDASVDIIGRIDQSRLSGDACAQLSQLVDLSLIVLLNSLIELFLDVSRAAALRDTLSVRLGFIQNGVLPNGNSRLSTHPSEDMIHAC